MNLHFQSVTPIDRGWSEDKKFLAAAEDGKKYLLRITPIERYETRKALFATLNQVAKLDIPMCRPVDFGTCPDGVYILYTWIAGKDANDVVPLLAESEQYALGIEAGRILKKIHSVPVPETQEDWYSRFNRKADAKIRQYRACPLRFPGDDEAIAYIENNRALLKDRPQCFQHGDYHIGNMMIQQGNLVIIDFDRFDFGDPWEEFNRIVWCAQASPAFAAGRLDGYFGGMPPAEFFRLLAFYIAVNTLSSVCWAASDVSETGTMLNQARDVLSWYCGFREVIPRWYLEQRSKRG